MKFKIVTEEEFNLVGKWSIDAYYQAFTHKEATNGVVKEMLNRMKQSGIFGDPAEENRNVSSNRAISLTVLLGTWKRFERPLP